MKLLHRLLDGVREVLRPAPWDPPDRDETTPEVIADWVGRHKHPAECAGGCRCKGG